MLSTKAPSDLADRIIDFMQRRGMLSQNSLKRANRMSASPKVVILAGGLGTRLSEETDVKPKPMVEIGDRPIFRHIMKLYAACGFKDFYLALGYKGDLIKRYFLDDVQLTGDLTIETENGNVMSRRNSCDNWRVHLWTPVRRRAPAERQATYARAA